MLLPLPLYHTTLTPDRHRDFHPVPLIHLLRQVSSPDTFFSMAFLTTPVRSGEDTFSDFIRFGIRCRVLVPVDRRGPLDIRDRQHYLLSSPRLTTYLLFSGILWILATFNLVILRILMRLELFPLCHFFPRCYMDGPPSFRCPFPS